MKITRESNRFNPITMVIETANDLRLFNDMVDTAYADSEYESEAEGFAEKLQNLLKSVD